MKTLWKAEGLDANPSSASVVVIIEAINMHDALYKAEQWAEKQEIKVNWYQIKTIRISAIGVIYSDINYN